MEMKLNLAAMVGVLVSGALMSTPAMADALADIKAKGEIAVAIDLGVPPWGMLDANLKPAGADVEIATKLAEDLGVKLRIVEVTGPNRVPFLLTNKADVVVASFAITPERAEVVDFVPYSVNRLIVFAPESVEIPDMAGLAGKSVGVVRGNLQDTELSKQAPEGTRLTRYDDDATTIQALLSGQVDAMSAPYGIFLNLAERFPDQNLEFKVDIVQQPLGVGLRKDEPELKAWLLEWSEAAHADGSLNTVFERYMGGPLPDLTPFYAETRASLQ